MPRLHEDKWRCTVFGGVQDGNKFIVEEPLENFYDEVAEVETEYSVFSINPDDKTVLYMPTEWIIRHTAGRFTLPQEES